MITKTNHMITPDFINIVRVQLHLEKHLNPNLFLSFVDIPDREQNEFNYAVSFLGRLNSLFYLCNDSAMNLDAARWFHALINLFREVSTEMKDPEIKRAEDYRRSINEKISIWNHKVNSTGQREINTDLYDDLHSFELLIRSVIKKAGLQGRTKGDPGAALR